MLKTTLALAFLLPVLPAQGLPDNPAPQDPAPRARGKQPSIDDLVRRLAEIQDRQDQLRSQIQDVEAKLREEPDAEPEHGLMRLLQRLRSQESSNEAASRAALQSLLQRQLVSAVNAPTTSTNPLELIRRAQQPPTGADAVPQDPRNPAAGRDDLPTRQEMLALRRAVDALRQEIRLLREALQQGDALRPSPDPVRRPPGQPIEAGRGYGGGGYGGGRGAPVPRAIPPEVPPGVSAPARSHRGVPPDSSTQPPGATPPETPRVPRGGRTGSGRAPAAIAEPPSPITPAAPATAPQPPAPPRRPDSIDRVNELDLLLAGSR